MTRTEFDELYIQLYKAYEMASLKDEYVRSTLGDALDHMIYLENTLPRVTLE
jgi:hypothetical protein